MDRLTCLDSGLGSLEHALVEEHGDYGAGPREHQEDPGEVGVFDLAIKSLHRDDSEGHSEVLGGNLSTA